MRAGERRMQRHLWPDAEGGLEGWKAGKGKSKTD
jgi:hypothetical protein